MVAMTTAQTLFWLRWQAKELPHLEKVKAVEVLAIALLGGPQEGLYKGSATLYSITLTWYKSVMILAKVIRRVGKISLL